MNLEIILVRTVLVLTAALSVGISLWGGYYLLTGLMSWRRPMDYGRHPAGTRFAVLIAARNEELVIGPLINSLLEQEYPAELYDIYVIPNNCTDNTALAARQFGHFHLAKPFEIDYSQQLRHPPRDIRPAPFAQLQAIADIARYRQVRPQGVALKYHGDIALLRRKMSDRSAGNSHLAALHRNKAAEGVQQRGFSASRRAQ